MNVARLAPFALILALLCGCAADSTSTHSVVLLNGSGEPLSRVELGDVDPDPEGVHGQPGDMWFTLAAKQEAVTVDGVRLMLSAGSVPVALCALPLGEGNDLERLPQKKARVGQFVEITPFVLESGLQYPTLMTLTDFERGGFSGELELYSGKTQVGAIPFAGTVVRPAN